MMKTFNLFTESYEVIRRTLREIFVYGCYDSSVGAQRQKISGRKYSDELKRIRCFWSKQISARRHGEKKINFFLFNSDNENYLSRSYQIHSFKPQDLNLYVYLLQILSDEKSYSVTQLIDEVQFHFPFEDDLAGIFYPMMSRKLTEMTAAGLLVRQGKSSYKLAADILADFSADELLRLYRILFLYRELLPLTSLGCQVQQVLGDYLCLSRGETELPNDCFCLEDIFYQSVLNDEVLYKLIVALEQRRHVAFLLPNRIVTKAVPQKIIFDCQYGRQYLAGEADGQRFFWRLDNISYLRLLEHFDAENSCDKNFLQHVWNASSKKSKSPCRIEIDFKVSNDEIHFIKRLNAEKRFGKVQSLNKNHCLFSIELTDPNELLPWIRSFGHAAMIRSSKNHDLKEKLQREWSETLENYLEPLKISAPEKNFSVDAPTKKFSPKDLPPTKIKQPELFSEFRNAFYRAIALVYNEILINGRQFDEKSLAAYLGKVSFDLNEKFSLSDTMIKKIISKGTDIKSFSLFCETEGYFVPTYDGELREIPEPPIRFLATEKRWLRTMLNAPLVENLLGKNLFDKLKTALKDTLPFPFEKFSVRNGQRTDGDNFNDPQLAKRILLLMKAIEEKIFLQYEQKANNGKKFCGICLPTKIIYSPYLQKFQVRVAIAADLKLINVSNFTKLELATRNDFFSEQNFSEPEPHNFLKLTIFPIHGLNDIERCFLLFSTNRKESWYDLASNVWHLKIYYRSFEKRALKRKILSLGKAVTVDEPKQLSENFIAELKLICALFDQEHEMPSDFFFRVDE